MQKFKTLKKVTYCRKTMAFKSGDSLAIRLPNTFHFSVDPVIIFMRDDNVVIRKIQSDMSQAFQLLAALPDDFMQDDRHDLL